MQLSKSGKLILVLIVVVLVSISAGCQSRDEGGQISRPSATLPKSKSVPLVSVVHPLQPDQGQMREYVGTVESRNQVALVPQVAGQLQEVNVSVGDRVTRGQVLAVVVDPENDAQLGQARATVAVAQSAVQNANANARAAEETINVRMQAVLQADATIAEAHASIAKAQSDVKLAQTTLMRTQELARRELIAQQDLDKAIASDSAATADLALAKARLRSAESAKRQAQMNVATARQQQRAAQAQIGSAEAQAQSLQEAARAVAVRTGLSQVRSPIDGVVVSRSLDPGAYVSPGSQSTILVIAKPDDLRVAFDLSELDMNLVHPGQTVSIRFDALPGKPQAGIVQGLAGGLDTASRTLRVEVSLPSQAGKIRPGMIGRLMVGQSSEGLLSIPLSAILSDKGEKFVYTLDKEKKIEKKTIHITVLKGDTALIRDGLERSDRVVIQGLNLVKEGQPVRLEAESKEEGR